MMTHVTNSDTAIQISLLSVLSWLQMIYLNPTASNPAGTTLPTHRKREIYRLACEYNMLILEDDPYYYLHFEKVIFLALYRVHDE